MSTTKKLTTSAIFIALSSVLAIVSKVIPVQFMQGGSVTIASMVPIIIISLCLGTKWGLASGILYGCIQMIMGFYPAPTPTFLNMALVVFLDYIAAFGVLGLASAFSRIFGKTRLSIPLSGLIVTFLRFVCHFFSGILIWGIYAEEGQPVALYSLLYNGGYMLPEIIITTVVLALLTPMLKKNKILK